MTPDSGPAAVAASAAERSRPLRVGRGGSRLAILAALLVASHLALGTVWMLRNLGAIPHDGDTMEFMSIAVGTREVDSYRGVLYPALLALADRCDGPDSFPEPMIWEGTPAEPCRGPRVLIAFQIGQIVVALLALSFFVRVFGRSLDWRERALLTALLLLDPLVGYLNLAVLTDGLALSASLVFCAALVELGRRQRPPLLAGAVLVAAYLLAANLRPDKRLVLLASLAATAAAWNWWARRGLVPWGAAKRAALALLAVMVAAAASIALHESLRGRSFRWDLTTMVLQQRVIWPHLAEIYDELPESVRARVKPTHARVYDRNVNNTWHVFNLITRWNADEVRELTLQIAPIALARTWPRLLFDLAKDFAENVFATLSYYVRLALWTARGASPLAFDYRLEATPLTYNALSWHHPRLSRAFAVSGALLLLLSLAASLAWLRRPGRRALPAEWRLEVVPVLAFLLLNALGFAAVLDLVHIRYAIAAHVVTLFLAYRGALAWLALAKGAAPAPGPVVE